MAGKEISPLDVDHRVPPGRPTHKHPSGVPQRLVVPLTDSGKVDWTRLTGKRRDDAARLIRDMRAKVKRDDDGAPRADPVGLGLDDETARPASSAAPSGVFDTAWAGLLLDMVGQLEQLAIVRVYHCTPTQAAAMLYTDADKRILSGPLVKVLNKYSATWLTDYADEFALAGLLVTVHAAKLSQVHAALARPLTPIATPTFGTARAESSSAPA